MGRKVETNSATVDYLSSLISAVYHLTFNLIGPFEKQDFQNAFVNQINPFYLLFKCDFL